jgi:hypothetical protein
MAISMFGIRFIKKINVKDKYLKINGSKKTWLDDFFDKSISKNEKKMPKMSF